MAGSLIPSRTSRRPSSLIEGDPFRELQEEMDNLLSRFAPTWDEEWTARARVPSVDLSETDDTFQVRMDMPGIKPEEIDIELSGNALHIKAERKEEHEEKGRTWHRIERRSGLMARSITLPSAVKEEEIQAECQNGVLTVTLPKSEQAARHRITVKGA